MILDLFFGCLSENRQDCYVFKWIFTLLTQTDICLWADYRSAHRDRDRDNKYCCSYVQKEIDIFQCKCTLLHIFLQCGECVLYCIYLLSAKF